MRLNSSPVYVVAWSYSGKVFSTMFTTIDVVDLNYIQYGSSIRIMFYSRYTLTE